MGNHEFQSSDIEDILIELVDSENVLEELIKRHNQLQIMIITLLELGATPGQARGTEIPRLDLITILGEGGESKHSADVIWQNKKQILVTYSGNQKSESLLPVEQSLNVEAARCLLLFFAIRKVLAFYVHSKNCQVSQPTSNLQIIDLELGSSGVHYLDAFLLKLGYKFNFISRNKVDIVEIHAAACLDDLVKLLGVKTMQLSKWRQIRVSISNSILENLRNVSKGEDDLLHFDSRFHFVLGQNQGSLVHVGSTADELISFDEFCSNNHGTLWDNCPEIAYEYNSGLGDMAFVLPHSIHDFNLFQLKTIQTKNTSLIVTPSEAMAHVKRKTLMDNAGDDCSVFVFDGDVVNVRQKLHAEKRNVIITTLHQIFKIDFESLVHAIDLREIFYTDLPLVIGNSDDLCRLQTMYRFKVPSSLLQVVVLPAFGKQLSRAVLESMGSRSILSTAQIERRTLLKSMGIDNGFVEANGYHDKSSLSKMMEMGNFIRTTRHVFDETQFFTDFAEKAITEISDLSHFVFFAEPSKFEMIAKAVAREDWTVVALQSLDEASISDFDRAEWSSNTFIFAIPEAAYVVNYFLNLKKAQDEDTASAHHSLTLAYATHEAGLFNYLQCFQCRCQDQDLFIYLHSENEMESERLQNVEDFDFKRAKEVFYSDSRQGSANKFSKQSIAAMLCSEDPTKFLAKYAGIEIEHADDTTADFLKDFDDVIEKAVPIDLKIAQLFADDSISTKLAKIRTFVQRDCNKWIPDRLKHNIERVSLLNDLKNFSILTKINDLKSCFQRKFGLENGPSTICYRCALPSHTVADIDKDMINHQMEEYRNTLNCSRNFQRKCIYDRRLCMLTASKSTCCDSCYVWQSYHGVTCQGDLLFIYIYMTFGIQEIYDKFEKTVPRAKDDTCKIDFDRENLVSRYTRSLSLWIKNLSWIAANERNNMDFWYFVMNYFPEKFNF